MKRLFCNYENIFEEKVTKEVFVSFHFLDIKKTPVKIFAGVFVFSRDFINLRLSCFLRKLSRVLFERQLELERILRIPL